MKIKNAFTLAEVLITLGIIGVVAAMTMPVLIQNHRKQVVETRLKKFYSTINQAVALSELENGPKEDWDIHNTDLTYKEWFEKYLAKYIKTLKITDNDSGSASVYFPDGSVATFHRYAIGFNPDAKTFDSSRTINGVNKFIFYFAPANESDEYHAHKGIEPYAHSWDGTENDIKNDATYGCYTGSNPAFCAKLIQLNGWKIPKDYPFKF